MKNYKQLFSFEFWQKFGKCLMVVIAVMPAAGLMVSIGNSLALIALPTINFLLDSGFAISNFS